jgi:hypothetical protein
MVEGRNKKERGQRETHPPPITVREFKDSPEFANFTGIMKRLLSVPKSELDDMVRAAKEASPRAGNPKAAGRKRKPASK